MNTLPPVSRVPARCCPQDLKTNREHCGKCGKLCNPGFGCTNGVCDDEKTCPNGQTKCGNNCVVSAVLGHAVRAALR
jgi:hypothetical protein